jgi:hypothetical protein
MDQEKKKWNLYTFPENEFFKTVEMTEEEAQAYCLRFDLIKEKVIERTP